MGFQSSAIMAAIISTAVLAFFFFYLFFNEHNRGLGILALGWTIYAVRFVFLLAWFHIGHNPYFFLFNQMSAAISGVLIFWGICLCTNKKMAIYWFVLLTVICGWIVFSVFTELSLLWQTLPTFVFLGIVTILTGLVFMKCSSIGGSNRYFIGICFIIWGLHKFDYPFFRPVPRLASCGFMFSVIMALIIAAGLLIAYMDKARNEILRSEDKFRMIAEKIHEVFWVISPDWSQIFYISPAYETIWGRPVESIYEKPLSWFDAVLEEDKEAVKLSIDTKIADGVSEQYFPEYRIRTPDGTIKWILAETFPVYGDDGKISRVVGLCRDITQRKIARIAQQKANMLLKTLMDCRHIIMRADDKIRMLEDVCNTIAETMECQLIWIGLAEDDPHRSVRPIAAAGPEKKYAQKIFVTWDEGEFGDGPTGRSIRTQQPQTQRDMQNDPLYESWKKPAVQHGFKSSAAIPLILNGQSIGAMNLYSDKADTFTKTDIIFLTELANDITFGIETLENRARRRQAEEGLALREENFRNILESNAVGIHCGAFDGRMVYANNTFLHMVGYTRDELAKGQLRWDSLTPPEFADIDRKVVQELKKKGYASPYQKEFIRRDGTRVPVLISAALIRHDDYDAVAFVVDLTEQIAVRKERDRLQEELRQTQKMDAIGKLAGGVAHDFNNVLMAIQGNADLLKSADLVKDEARNFVEEIIKASERAADLTNQLLTFSRKRRMQIESVDIHNIINEVCTLLSRSIDKRIELTLSLSAAKSTLRGDSSQLHSALLNMGINARDAMPDGGRLVFATRNVRLEEKDRFDDGEAFTPGEYIEISVDDTGKGIDENNIDRIFEPFFTTKETGKGTGLGLASVYGCVKEHKGNISVTSMVNKGSTFRILLPVIDAPAKAAPAPAVRQKTQKTGGAILVVDDEASVQTFIRCTLEQNGHRVFCCNNGQEAVEFFEHHKGMVDLVILDVVMPKISGTDTFYRLREIDPNVRVLLISGFSRDNAIERLLNEGALGFISKPFRIKTFTNMVARYVAM